MYFGLGLYDKQNIADDKKVYETYDFARKYKNNVELFLELMCNFCFL